MTKQVIFKRPNTPAARTLTGFVDQMHSQMLAFNPPNKYRVQEPVDRPRLRGSDLPVCPMKLALDTVRENQRTQFTTFMSDFYTRVGSEYHAVIQKWFGVSGIMYGKYRCPVCSTLYPKGSEQNDKEAMLGPVFCKCKKLPVCCEYVELEPFGTGDASSFQGHTDGVALIDGKYVVLEFKTTSTAKVTKRRKEGPDHKHVLQSTAYRRVMPKFLDMDESKWWDYMLIIYYDRANPKNNVVLCVPYDYDNFQDEVDTFVKTLRLVKSKRYWKIKGKCESRSDEQYCPYNAMCFSPQSDKLIDNIMPGYVRRKIKDIKSKK